MGTASGVIAGVAPPWTATQRRVSMAVAGAERQAILLLGDLAMVNAALLFTLYTSPWTALWASWKLTTGRLGWCLTLSAVWCVVGLLVGCYDLRTAFRAATAVPRTLLASSLACGVYLMIPRLSAPITQSRGLMLIFAGAVLALVLAWRLVCVATLWHPVLRRRVLILGTGPAARDLGKTIESEPASDYSLLGYVELEGEAPSQAPSPLALLGAEDGSDLSCVVADIAQTVPAPEPAPTARPGAIRVLCSAPALPDLLRTREVDEVVLASTAPLPAEVERALVDAYQAGIQVTPLAPVYEALTGRVPVEHVGSYWVVSLPRVAPGLTYVALKRLADLILAGAGLALTALVLPFVAVLVTWRSPGPIFFRQQRVGRFGKPFTLVKFRSMHALPEDGSAESITDDDRHTTIGRLLRRCRVDELPQFWNVLQGDMSLIGPRPFVPGEVDALSQHIPFFRARLLVRPGLTGWAQINHGYSNTIANASVKLQYDLFYLKHRSFYLDIVIALRTIAVMLQFRGT